MSAAAGAGLSVAAPRFALDTLLRSWEDTMELDIARATGEEDRRPPPSLLIDCDTCQVRGDACADCVVTCLLGGPPEPVHLDPDEIDALGALAGLGMLPPLRLVTAVSSPDLLTEEHPTEEHPTEELPADGC